MTQTTNFQLNQWSPEDYVRRTDFNADNAKIDAALAAAGNCTIETGKYTGTGTAGANNPNSLSFQSLPQIVFLNIQEATDYNSVPEYYILFRGCSKAIGFETSDKCTISWNEKTLSWYTTSTRSDAAKYQFNTKDKVYQYIAICIKE